MNIQVRQIKETHADVELQAGVGSCKDLLHNCTIISENEKKTEQLFCHIKNWYWMNWSEIETRLWFGIYQVLLDFYISSPGVSGSLHISVLALTLLIIVRQQQIREVIE